VSEATVSFTADGGEDMARRPRLMAVQGAALIVGAVFLLLGALGFLPGVTVHHDSLAWAGHQSDAELFGVFGISVLHNVIHLIYGIAGLICARTYSASRAYLFSGGAILVGLWIYRMAADHPYLTALFPLNRADSWLHFGLGVVMVVLALTLAAQHDPTKPGARARARARAQTKSRA
jgi:arginine exporter protein ArgO